MRIFHLCAKKRFLVMTLICLMGVFEDKIVNFLTNLPGRLFPQFDIVYNKGMAILGLFSFEVVSKKCPWLSEESNLFN